MNDDDLPFLRRVYASTRAEELVMTPWEESEKESFLKMQFEAQHSHYQKHFPHASYQIIEKEGEPIGRLYLDRRPDELRIAREVTTDWREGDGWRLTGEDGAF